MADVHHQWYLPTPEKNNPNHWQIGDFPPLLLLLSRIDPSALMARDQSWASVHFHHCRWKVLLLALSPSLLGMSQRCQLMTLSVPPVILVRPPKALAPKAHGWGGGGLSIFVSSASLVALGEKKVKRDASTNVTNVTKEFRRGGGGGGCMWRKLIKIGCFCRYFQICMGSPELCFYGSECMTPWTASAGRAGLLLLQPPNQPHCITGLPKFLVYSAFLFEFSFLASVTVF